MSSINQDIRYSNSQTDENNPQALYNFIKPARWVFNNVNPLPTSGENEWFYLNTVSGDLFQKTNGQWFLVYNFTTGASTGITNNQSNGTGESIVLPVVGNTGEFKSILGTVDETDINDEGNELRISMSPAYKPFLLRRIGNNRVLGASVGVDSVNPQGNLGIAEGFNRGSLFVLLGAGNSVYVCEDEVAKTWSLVFSENTLASLTNIGTGGEVYDQQVGKIAQLRTMIGQTGEIDILQNPANLNFSMSDLYKPVTLSNVQNVTIGYDKVSAPLPSNGSNEGYVRGSLWIETEIAGANKIWICRDPTPGSATWDEFSSGGSSVKESAMFAQFPRHIQTGLEFTPYKEINFNTPNVIEQSGPATWSFVSGGISGQLFRRGPSTANKRYLVTVYVEIDDFISGSTNLYDYKIRMVDDSDTFVSGSAFSIYLPPSLTSISANTGSTSFVLSVPSAGTVNFSFQIIGSTSGGGTTAPNIGFESTTITFTEI